MFLSMKLPLLCLFLCFAVFSANAFKLPVTFETEAVIAEAVIGAGTFQKIWLKLSTEEAKAWVGTVALKEKAGVTWFNTTSSATYKSTGKTAHFKCDPGSMDGFVSSDNFSFGHGASVKSIDFLAVEQNNECNFISQMTGKFAGSIGVSPKSEGLFKQLVDQKVISKPTMQLRKNNDLNGELIFGEETSTVSFSDKIVGDGEAWMVNGKSASFDGNDVKIPFLGFSFGKYAFIGPQDDMDVFYKSIGATDMPHATGLKVVDCSKVGTLPPAVFNLPSGATVTIKDTQYVKNVYGMCMVIAFGVDEPVKYWGIGISAMADNNIVMNIEDMSIGFSN